MSKLQPVELSSTVPVMSSNRLCEALAAHHEWVGVWTVHLIRCGFVVGILADLPTIAVMN
jgi:hypothetical protein